MSRSGYTNTRQAKFPDGFGRIPFLVRIISSTAIPGLGYAFAFEYTVARVIGIDNTKTDATYWKVSTKQFKAYNGFEWVPVGTTAITGEGIKTVVASGKPTTSFAGTTAGSCIWRAIGAGAVVWCVAFRDQDGNVIYTFSAPRSAQP